MNIEQNRQKLEILNCKLNELVLAFPHRLGVDLFYCNMIKDYYTVPSFYNFGNGWMNEYQSKKLSIILNICENSSFEKMIELLGYTVDDLNELHLDRIIFNINYVNSLTLKDFGLDEIYEAMKYRNDFYKHTAISNENIMKMKFPYSKLYEIYRVIFSAVSRFIYTMEFNEIRQSVGSYDYKFQIICGDGIIERLKYKEKIFEIEDELRLLISEMKVERGEVR